MAPEVGSVVGGKYRLFKPLARGGMGSIWVARHTELDVSVAIKLIAPELLSSDTALSRFRHEARAAAQLRSPHVVQILDYGVDEGVPYMAMELLSGEDLGALLEREGRLGIDRALELFRPVCKALKLAHEARIVHRDLKPANIFVAKVGDDEVVKVLDFGIAKALGGDGSMKHTASATLVGSPLYMSPEQSRGDEVDARSDIWSLGVVAFEALVGRPPFEGRGIGDLFAQVCHGPTPTPSTLGVDLPGLDAFFARSLAKAPADRQASVGEWLSELEACARSGSSRAFGGSSIGSTFGAGAPPRVAAAHTAALVDSGATVESPQPTNPERREARRFPMALLVAAPLLALVGLGAFVWSRSGASDAGIEAARAASASPPADHALSAAARAPDLGGPQVLPAPSQAAASPSVEPSMPVASASASSAPSAAPPGSGHPAAQPTAVAQTARPRTPSPSAAPVKSAPASAKPPDARPPSTTDPVFGIPGGR